MEKKSRAAISVPEKEPAGTAVKPYEPFIKVYEPEKTHREVDDSSLVYGSARDLPYNPVVDIAPAVVELPYRVREAMRQRGDSVKEVLQSGTFDIVVGLRRIYFVTDTDVYTTEREP